MTATLNVQPGQMELTPQKVSWNSTDLGGTLGNVQVDIKVMKSPIKADQYGETELDNRISGLDVQVTTEFAETRSLDVLEALFPSFLRQEGGGDDSLTARLQIGRSDRDNAQLLTLHPVVLDDADLTQDWNFLLAYPTEESQLTFSPTEQTKAKVVWKCYPVLTGSNAPQWGYLGVLP